MYPTVFIRARGMTETIEPGGMAHHGHPGHHGHGHHDHHTEPVIHHHTAVTATACTTTVPGIVPQSPARIRIGWALGLCSLFFLLMGIVIVATSFISGTRVWVTGLVFSLIGAVMLVLGVSLYRKGRAQQLQQGTVYPPSVLTTAQPVGQPMVYPPPSGVPAYQPVPGQPMVYPPSTGLPMGQPAGQPMVYPPPSGVPGGQPIVQPQPTYKPEEVAYQPQTQPGAQPYPQHYTPMVPYTQPHADDASPVVPSAPPPAYNDVLTDMPEKDESQL